MQPKYRWAAGIAALLLIGAAVMSTASPPIFTKEVTDYGRNRWRTHYTPTEPEFPRAENARPIWEVPLGLSRSQPLVVKRDFDGDGEPEVRIYHIAGDRLWALNGEIIPTPRQAGQSVEAYRQQLRREGFILWSVPAERLCALPGPAERDDLLAQSCARVGSRTEQRPFASSQAAYWKGADPEDDVIYVGMGHPPSVQAIRATDGAVLGGYIIPPDGDRGIVGAPLPFSGDTVVIGTTSGEAYIIKGIGTDGIARVRSTPVGGRISFSPMPLGATGFIIASDARYSPERGTHGYMMAYSLATPEVREFTPKWPAAVITPAGIPGEAAIDARTVFFADKFGKLYALRVDTGELLWCRQYPGFGPCDGSRGAPAFINNGPGVDENHVYFVFRNNRGPNQGGGHVVALNKATGTLVWERPMEFKGNTAPVPMGNVVIVGDTGGYVQAFDKETGEPVDYGGYPLRLSDEPYKEGTQGEKWWEPIGGTATQMTVAAEMMLVGVNSVSEDRTVLKAYKLYRLPDLTLEYLDVPAAADAQGFTARVWAVCKSCGDPLTTTVSLRINGMELPRQAVTFRPENGWAADLSWHSGILPQGNAVEVVAMVDPDDNVDEADETNNRLRATVYITMPTEGQPNDRWGSKLIE